MREVDWGGRSLGNGCGLHTCFHGRPFRARDELVALRRRGLRPREGGGEQHTSSEEGGVVVMDTRRTVRCDVRGVETRRGRRLPSATTYVMIATAMLSGALSTAQANVPLRIEWLDEAWLFSPLSDGQGDYLAETDLGFPGDENVPTIKVKTAAAGTYGWGMAEARISRPFRVVLDENPAVPVRLQGDVAAKLKIDNTWGGDNGEVKFRAKAGIEDTPIQYSKQWRKKDQDISKNYADTILVEGALPANQTHTVTGYAYALGDSDLGHTGHQYRANGTLSLPNPVVISDPMTAQYYDVHWHEDAWSWKVDGDASGIGALDLFSDLIGSQFPPPWDVLLNEGLDAYFEKSSTAEHIEGHFRPGQGESRVLARGRYGGHAWTYIESERDFSIVPAQDALAQLRFDGNLSGLLSGVAESSAFSLAEVSVAGSGLHWGYERWVGSDESMSVDMDITARGMARLNEVYTFEGLLRTESSSLAPGGLASADFLSSLEGRLSVHVAPVPGAAALIAIGAPFVIGAFRARNRRTRRDRTPPF